MAPVAALFAVAVTGCATGEDESTLEGTSEGKIVVQQPPVRPALGVDDSRSIVLRAPENEAAAHHDTSGPLTLLPPAPRPTENIEHEVKRLPRPVGAEIVDRGVQTLAPLLLMPSLAVNFDGLGNGFTGPGGTFRFAGTPPDTNGDVGPNHYVQTVNTDFAIFDKTGKPVFGPVPVNTLFSGFGGGCESNNDGDPVVLYDPIADRWVISQFSVNTTPYLQCVAVSTTPNPAGTYNRYAFDYGSSDFPDYPKMGVWPDAYYTSFNVFAGGQSFAGPRICAYDRARMLAGQPATQQCFDVKNQNLGGMLPADLDGARLPPAGSPNYVLALGETATTLAVWKFHVDWTTPANSTLTGPSNLTVPSISQICTATSGDCVPQPGSAGKLQGLDDRLMFRLAYRNFGDHESMVVTHAVKAGSSSGIRWYELRIAGQTPSIFQQGTYAPDAGFRWLGSAAQDRAGNMALGFSLSSTTIAPSIHYTGRLVGDALGTLGQGEAAIIAGGGSQTDNSGGGRNRWGDYSSMSVDPADDCTFWYTTEYLKANGGFSTWSTRVASFKFPGCAPGANNSFTLTPSPSSASVLQGGSTTFNIASAVTAGNAQTVQLSLSGLPAGATATFAPASVQTGNSSTLTINVGGSTATGTYSLTITGAGSSSSATAAISLTVTAAQKPDFTLAVSPSSQNVTAGANTSFTVTATPANGFSGTVALAVTGMPSGSTGTFSGNALTGATLSVTTTSATPSGSFALTFTGTNGALSHTVGATLNVNAAAQADFTLALDKNTVNVTAGQSTAAAVTTTAINGFSGDVSLSGSGLPAGVTATFSPTSIHGAGSSQVSFTASSSATAGTSVVTIAGSSNNLSHSAQITVRVVAAQTPDFTLALSPTAASVNAGGSTITSVAVAASGGFTSDVALSASGAAGISVTFATSTINGSGSTNATVSAAASVAAGTYAVTVSGSSGSLRHTASFSLTVNRPSTSGVAFADDVESGNVGWVTYASNPRDSGWIIEQTSNGNHRWRSSSGNYANNAASFLISPAFSLDGAKTAALKFLYKFHTEAQFDFFYVWATADEGKTWTQLAHGTGASRGWNQWAPEASLDMSQFAGKRTVRIAYSVQSDGSVTDWGAAVDNIRVVTDGAAAGGQHVTSL